MKQKWKFLSERVRWVILLLLGFGAVLLFALAVSCLYLHRMLFFLLPAAALYILLIVLIRKELEHPFQETEKMMELFTEGYTLQGVSSQDHPASAATEAAFDKLQELLSMRPKGKHSTSHCRIRSIHISCITPWRESGGKPLPPD